MNFILVKKSNKTTFCFEEELKYLTVTFPCFRRKVKKNTFTSLSLHILNTKYRIIFNIWVLSYLTGLNLKTTAFFYERNSVYAIAIIYLAIFPVFYSLSESTEGIRWIRKGKKKTFPFIVFYLRNLFGILTDFYLSLSVRFAYCPGSARLDFSWNSCPFLEDVAVSIVAVIWFLCFSRLDTTFFFTIFLFVLA